MLRREPGGAHATLGKLYADAMFQCDTLEDPVREVAGQPVAKWKVPGETAIPQGRYRLEITYSRRFGRDLPLLLDVPGFSGVRIHPGNTAADTEGCILTGTRMGPATVVESRRAFAALLQKIDAALDAGEGVYIDIRNAEAV